MATDISNALKRPSDNENSAPRKVRKGTQSCWECKRRKVRCTFAASENSSCEPCTQRGTLCVSQELPDPGRTSQIDDRLGRVEAVLEDVLRRLPAQEADRHNPHQQQDSQPPAHVPPPDVSPARHDFHDVATELVLGQVDQESRPSESLTTGSDELSRKLISAATALPTQDELELISREPFEVPSCLQGLPCVQSLSDRTSVSWRELMRPPATGSHPVVLTKIHLILASYLQTLSQGAMERLSLLGVDHQGIASNAIQTARRLVLSNHGMIRSLDGIECLYIESMYHNNAGRLRDAWLILRTAISTAQLLGMDRRAFSQLPFTEFHRKESREESIWVHLLASDRYLSLVLGLPQGAANSNSFSFPEAMAPHTPDERLRRTHCAAGGIMLKHTDHRDNDTAYVEEINVLLREAAANLNPQWWLIPESLNRGQPVTAQDTLRLMTQFTHYHILARLHLPYLLKSPADGTFDPHKLTTINASREILVRYLALRGSNSTSNYCRGVDFLMFIAAATLCIAHINSSHWRRLNGQGPHFDFLAHQRPGDRGLLERALEAVEHTGRQNDDEIDTRVAVVLQHLLDNENKAATGSIFTISTAATNSTVNFPGGWSNDDGTLKIDVPNIGLIKIERGRSHDSMNIQGQEWSLQGIDTTFFNDLIQDWEIDAPDL
ncbi:hypothetical protein M409DRAFT_70265 [Zasmidium cellare ATCC 36951]|uniref:Zn(2)-C6 fungal-type domain-containing protein n=1 Tax=Zasmidium cellare ATCC 36951 TaxID=1080233 RepID=A0A6A6C121_ZASCE|nr:uncharacterized protein M409DRAFT_70265 [Zasmidium cellare ATCC 36951]KAF2160734.1 hypothetical protein M409DRAFT_70265 [Zasmidium cellare ATCC 36951]